MKRAIAAIVLVSIAAFCLSGCEGRHASPFEAANEIYTYERVDKGKTVITASVSGNIAISALADAFEEENPDVQVIVIDITGGSENYRPLAQWLKNGLAPDVVFSQTRFMSDDDTKQCFENLSANPVIDDYTAGSLSRVSLDGNIYMLPGPSTLYCMHYNKSMFEKYGWEFPKTVDEFTALCERIRLDTNGEVQPFNSNAKYSSELIALLEAMCYEELFAGVENRSWYLGVIAGTARFKGHMEPFYETAKKLIDGGVLPAEHFSYSATTRLKEFWAGKIAMLNFSVATTDDPAFEVGYAPFPSVTGKGYICDIMDVVLGVSISKNRTEKQKDAIDRFLKFLSTASAQDLLANGRIMFSSIKDSYHLGMGDISELDETIAAGRMFSRLDFENSAITRDDLRNGVMAMASGEKSADECVDEIDDKIARGPTPVEFPVLGEASRDMTILETSLFMADMYREKAQSEIALITNNNVYRGNAMRVFKGDINEEMVKVLMPRSFGNDSALIKAEMTGSQLIAALNRPVGNGADADCIYAFSGLKCTADPWKPLGEKYLSVTLENGDKIDNDKLYSVAFWEGTVYDEYITRVVERFEGSFTDLLADKLRRDKTVSPPKDGRITLKWN